LQEIPTRYSYYFNFIKKISLDFRELLAELDLTTNPKNAEISSKLLSNLSESIQILDQIKHLEDQVQSRIKELENLKNG
jgi:hypothetical protein